MNPYLKQPGLWPQVHNRLIVALADAITPQVASKYRISIEERIYTTTDPLPLVGIADVALAKRGNLPIRSEATAQLTTPRRVQVPLPVEMTERFEEVRLVINLGLTKIPSAAGENPPEERRRLPSRSAIFDTPISTCIDRSVGLTIRSIGVKTGSVMSLVIAFYPEPACQT